MFAEGKIILVTDASTVRLKGLGEENSGGGIGGDEKVLSSCAPELSGVLSSGSSPTANGGSNSHFSRLEVDVLYLHAAKPDGQLLLPPDDKRKRDYDEAIVQYPALTRQLNGRFASVGLVQGNVEQGAQQVADALERLLDVDKFDPSDAPRRAVACLANECGRKSLWVAADSLLQPGVPQLELGVVLTRDQLRDLTMRVRGLAAVARSATGQPDDDEPAALLEGDGLDGWSFRDVSYLRGLRDCGGLAHVVGPASVSATPISLEEFVRDYCRRLRTGKNDKILFGLRTEELPCAFSAWKN